MEIMYSFVLSISENLLLNENTETNISNSLNK